MFDQRWAGGAAALAIAASLAPVAVYAQETTSSVAGTVVTEGGSPVAGATVTIRDTRTGATRTVTTDADGSFSASSLAVGGPYTISARATGFAASTIEDVRLALGSQAQLTLQLGAAGTDEIVVRASRQNIAQVAIGPSSSFDLESIESFPSIQRQIADIIRFDPRVTIDLSNDVQRISCIGGNDRTNTLTVDGVIRADVFGLNGTPFAARNTFIVPFDSLAQTTVEFAPFDVEYGQFTGCNINVVTKSGTNEFSGSVFGFYNSNDLQGDEVDGTNFTINEFEDYNYGFTLGGPIIKDKLFFFVAYEETDDADPQTDGPAGAGFGDNSFDSIDLATANELIQIAQDVYGYPTGGIATTLPQSSERWLARFDWLINDDHRLEVTYDQLEESNVEPDDYGRNFDTFTPFGSFEDEGTDSNTISARLFSQWTDQLSTEIRYSRADVSDIQGPVNGGEAQSANPLPRLIVPTEFTDAGGRTDRGTFIAGPGNFRSANQLDTVTTQLKLKADYEVENHTYTAGYELNHIDVFNLFIRNATGALIFGSIDDFRNGTLVPAGGSRDDEFPSAENILAGQLEPAYGEFSFSGVPGDAAAQFERSIHALYVQDEWRPLPGLEILAGLRYEFYQGDDTPLANANFDSRFGFSNQRGFDDLDIWLPRVGLNYELPDTKWGEKSIRLGAGVFTGGDPTVWFSNAYSNAGANVAEGVFSDFCTDADRQVIDGSGNFTGLPECVRLSGSTIASAAGGDTQSTDPDLELQSVIRTNFGMTWLTDFGGAANGFFDDWKIDVDYIYSRFRNPYNFVDLVQTVDPSLGNNGRMIDGRRIYRAIDPLNAGCNAELQGTGGTPPVWTGVTEECFAGVRVDDFIQLTNDEGFGASTFSILLDKDFDYQLFNTDGRARFNMGYAYSDVENRRDLTSAQSTSNYDGTALFDRQNPGVGTSGFETRHNFTMALNFDQEFIKDYRTNVGLFFSAQSGRPYSFVFEGGGVFSDPSSGNDNALLYVPTGADDPFLSPDSDAGAVAAYLDLIDSNECLGDSRGGRFERNSCRADWFLDLDIRFSQEFPVPGRLDDKLIAFIDVDNFANLLNSDWNVRRTVGQRVSVVETDIDDQGRYVISNFQGGNFRDGGEVDDNISFGASAWTIQVGAKYEF